jgi:hypothetical protein
MMGLIALSKTPKGRGERLRRAQAPFFCFESPNLDSVDKSWALQYSADRIHITDSRQVGGARVREGKQPTPCG